MTETILSDIAVKYGSAGVSVILAAILYLTIKMFLNFVNTINKENIRRDEKHLKMYNRLSKVVNKTLEYQKLQNGGVKAALEGMKVSVCDSMKALKGFEKTIQKIADKK